MTDTMLKRRAVSSFACGVHPELLMAMMTRYYHTPVILDVHRALVRSRLQGETLDGGHPYAAFLSRRGIPDVAQQVTWRCETVDDMRARGIQEAVAAYFDDGGLVYYHGYHRLAFALEEGLTTMPVQFLLLSKALSDVCTTLFGIYRNQPYTVYQPLQHDLFRLLPVHQPELPAKSAMIALSMPADSFVDMGCHLGYMTRRLTGFGWGGYGFDSDVRLVELQHHLQFLGERPVRVCAWSVEEFMEAEPFRPCTAIIMGLLHHFLATEERTQRQFVPLAAWLRRNCAAAVVEMAYGKHVDQPGQEAMTPHVALSGTQDAVTFWLQHGFTATTVYVDGGTGRETFRLQRIQT